MLEQKSRMRIDTEKREADADLYRKYELDDDISGERQENFCN